MNIKPHKLQRVCACPHIKRNYPTVLWLQQPGFGDFSTQSSMCQSQFATVLGIKSRASQPGLGEVWGRLLSATILVVSVPLPHACCLPAHCTELTSSPAPPQQEPSQIRGAEDHTLCHHPGMGKRAAGAKGKQQRPRCALRRRQTELPAQQPAALCDRLSCGENHSTATHLKTSPDLLLRWLQDTQRSEVS